MLTASDFQPGAVDLEAVEVAEGAEGEPKPEGAEDGEGEEANLSLAAMEQTLLPQVMETFDKIAALHKKLEKVQLKRLETIRAGEELNPRSEKAYEKQKLEMVELMRTVKLNNFRIEFRSARTNDPVDVGNVRLNAAMSMPGMTMAGTTTVSISVAITPPCMTPAGWRYSGRNATRSRA